MANRKRMSDLQKAQIICLSQEKIPNREITGRLGCNEASVSRFVSSECILFYLNYIKIFFQLNIDKFFQSTINQMFCFIC